MLIIEDIVTSGISVMETVQPLKDVGLVVRDVAVLINREQGGEANLKKQGLVLHSVMTITQILHVLLENRKIDVELANKVKNFIANTAPVNSVSLVKNIVLANRMKLEDRIAFCKNPTAAALLKIMVQKKSNLCIAADLIQPKDLLRVIDLVGPFVCLVKTHIDILEKFTVQIIKELTTLAKKHSFLLFEDRKFADIGNTVALQYQSGIYHISEWADIVNAHLLPGPGIIDGLAKVGQPLNRGLLLLAEMSSSQNLITPNYTKKTLEFALDPKYSKFVIGFISQHALTDVPHLIHMTPGVQGGIEDSKSAMGDHLGQQYLTPYRVIVENGSDVIIVGRGIYEAKDPAHAAQLYQKAGWNAYLKKTEKKSSL